MNGPVLHESVAGSRQAEEPAATPPTVWLCCGVLRAELEELHRLGKIRGKLQFLDSMLHMDPQKLEIVLAAALEQPGPERGVLVLVYGDCCPRMLDLARRFRVGRVNAINCAQILVGRARYRELTQGQAFMLLPEWTLRWKEIFRVELGLKEEVARDLMQDQSRVLVYLDTGLAKVPQQALADCAAFIGLPWRVEPVTLDNLLAMLLEAQTTATVRPSSKQAS